MNNLEEALALFNCKVKWKVFICEFTRKIDRETVDLSLYRDMIENAMQDNFSRSSLLFLEVGESYFVYIARDNIGRLPRVKFAQQVSQDCGFQNLGRVSGRSRCLFQQVKAKKRLANIVSEISEALK